MLTEEYLVANSRSDMGSGSEMRGILKELFRIWGSGAGIETEGEA
jgi:hypothetical protein